MKFLRSLEMGELFGGLSASLVALPSAIAFGIVIYSPLGSEFMAKSVIAGCVGAVVLGLLSALLTGTPSLISGPGATTGAVLGLLVNDLLSQEVPPEMIPLLIILASMGGGLTQILFGVLKGGHFIKFIPYPVVAGFMGGVGISLIHSQISKFFGVPGSKNILVLLGNITNFRWESITIGTVSIMVMVFIPKVIKKIPAPIMALLSGVFIYGLIAVLNPELRTLENNKLLIGKINFSIPEVKKSLMENINLIKNLEFHYLLELFVPTITLGLLLSIDSLKTCVMLDVLRGDKHNSNKELFAQGIGNLGSAMFGGIPGVGATGYTMVNYYGGGKTQISSIIAALCSLLILFLLSPLISWIPISALAGMLIVIGTRMIDFKSARLFSNPATRFDFFVIVCVIVASITLSLIAAAGVGIAMAAALFIREQVRTSVIHQLTNISKTHSKKTRTPSQQRILLENGDICLVIELQGQLFFGTTDQLYQEIDPYFTKCKYFILDMRRVQSIDFTATNMLQQIKRKIIQNNGIMILSSFPTAAKTGKNLLEYLKNFGFQTEGSDVLVFNEMSDAIQWVEDKMLGFEPDQYEESPLQLEEFEFFKNASSRSIKTILGITSEKRFLKDEKIFRIGDTGGSVFFIRNGEIRIEIPLSNGGKSHRATFSKGGFFGDMSFLDQEKRSADAVVISEYVDVYVLNRDEFNSVAAKYPEISTIFYEKMSYQISNRLRSNLLEIKGLQE